MDWELADYLIDHLGDADYACCKDTALGTSVEIFTMDALEKTYMDAKMQEEREHVCPYIVRHPELFKCKVIPYNYYPYRLTVDEEADYRLVDIIYRDLYHAIPIRNKLIYDYLASRPDLQNLNKTVHQKVL